MLSSGTNVIICDKMLSSGANVIMVSSVANVIIWCYHVMLSSGMITHLFFIFPENFTHSLRRGKCLVPTYRRPPILILTYKVFLGEFWRMLQTRSCTLGETCKRRVARQSLSVARQSLATVADKMTYFTYRCMFSTEVRMVQGGFLYFSLHISFFDENMGTRVMWRGRGWRGGGELEGKGRRGG
jgi:hypothetical protein